MYLFGAFFLILLVASSLLGIAVQMLIMSYLIYGTTRRLGLVTLAAALLGSVVGVGLLFLMHHMMHSEYSGDAVRVALWGLSGYGWGGITALLIAKFLASPGENGWAGMLLGCEFISFLVVGLILYGYVKT